MLKFIKDRFIRQEMEKEEKEIKVGFAISGALTAIVIANLVYLNIFIATHNTTPPKLAAATVSTPTAAPSPISTASAVVQPPAQQVAVVQPKNTQKDYYINLGSGTNQSTDWTDVAGTLSTFDIAQYQNIKEVHLETTVNAPTANGTISVRLFNKTDGTAVWNSDRTVNAQISGDLLISQNIFYSYGPKLYSVQMKSQLGILANLAQARLHIITH